jgi:hypothetical protein
MRKGVEGKQEEIASRHQPAALPFGAILTFVGARDGARGTAGAAPPPWRRRRPRLPTAEAVCAASPEGGADSTIVGMGAIYLLVPRGSLQPVAPADGRFHAVIASQTR